jgi:hypothetical protein
MYDFTHGSLRRASLVACVVGLALAPLHSLAAEAPAQKHFKEPAEAVRALVAAARTDDKAALIAILGPDAEEIVSSGDPVEDAAARKRVVAAAAARTRFEALDDTRTIVHLGKDDWPLPIPLVKDADGWRFDTAAGKEEILNRRIGKNELAVIEGARAYVEAQREYAKQPRDGSNVRAFAQKIRSDPGKHDGLYWEASSPKDESPLGPLFAEATGEGYAVKDAPATPQPYHGYFYRILTAQGPSAPGGAKRWVKDGSMIGGFGLIAWPADHGSSGVMTFIVGPTGIVYQKDLGGQTAELAKAITTYDPDDSWTPVR